MVPALSNGAESLGLAGAEVSPDSSYVYMGATLPIHGSRLGSGIVQRYWLDRLTYSYKNNGRNIDARAWGAEGALGYQGNPSWGWWGTYFGLLYRDTRLSPDDLGSTSRGGKIRGRFQLEGERDLNDAWRVNGNASYVFGQDSYWIRGRVLYKVNGRISTGLEMITQGDPDYNAAQLGWVVLGLSAGPNVDLGLKIGAKRTKGEAAQGYLGIELSRLF